MNKEKKKTLIIAVTLVGVLLLVGYFIVGRGETEQVIFKEGNSSQSLQGNVLGSDVLRLISQVDGLSLDTGLFNDGAFLNLKDISVPVQAEQVGKQNPFSN